MAVTAGATSPHRIRPIGLLHTFRALVGFEPGDRRKTIAGFALAAPRSMLYRLPVLALLGLVPFLVSPAHAQATMSGAGSSAAAPVYKVWAQEYAKKRGDALAYEPVGSGAGMARIRKREVDFGASDVIASRAELDKDGLVMVPTVITGVVPVVNLPRVAPNTLRLTGEVLAQIFLGQITQWDAAPIKALNPAIALPNLPIKVIARADGSGTTYHFSDYLSRVSPAWKQRYGVGSKFDWPAQTVSVKGSGEVSK